MHHHTTTLLIATLLITPGVVFGQDSFVPLVGIPYIDGGEVQSIGDYVNAFYFAAISIAAFLAVVRIIFAGVKYMLSDIVTTKQVAKKDIRTALLGLLIVVGAVLILRTINSELTEIQLFPDDAPVPQISGNFQLREFLYTERNSEADAVIESCRGRGTIQTRNIGGQGSRDAGVTVCCLNDGTSTDSLCQSLYAREEFESEFDQYSFSNDNREDNARDRAACLEIEGAEIVTGTNRDRVYNFTCVVPEGSPSPEPAEEPAATNPSFREVGYRNSTQADHQEDLAACRAIDGARAEIGIQRSRVYTFTCIIPN